jgi:hypothetical protein
MENTDAVEKWKSLPLNTWRMAKLVRHACNIDDVSLMTQVISMAGQDDSSVMVPEVLQEALTLAGRRDAMHCLAYILELGADVSHVEHHYAYPEFGNDPSREALELLVAHGWNVNTGALNGEAGIPLLWSVVGDRELVQWCLDHGADVNPPDHTPPNAMSLRKPLLEDAAWSGNMETFELLRARGAPMHYGVFPNAVMAANLKAVNNRAAFPQQMDMLRHLLGVVKCDVNEMTYGAHYESGSVCVNPLCWIACHPRPNDTTAEMEELICFLLDNGGDPDLTMEHRGFSRDDDVTIRSASESARQGHSHFFLKIVEEWEANHRIKALKNCA